MENFINRDNVNTLLNAFAKEYKKQFGRTPIEITVVGGGSILLNYGFRNATQDFDVMTRASGIVKDVAIKVAGAYNFPPDWINEDFKYTSSFSPKLESVSKFYKSLNNGAITIRTVKAEYLVAMKMQSDREFEHDVSDIIGIIKAEFENGSPLSFEKILAAGEYLYERNFLISESLKARVEKYCMMDLNELQKAYNDSVEKAEAIKNKLIDMNITDRNSTKWQGVLLEQRLTESVSNPEFIMIVGLLETEKHNEAMHLQKTSENACRVILESEEYEKFIGEPKDFIYHLEDRIKNELEAGVNVIFVASDFELEKRLALLAVAENSFASERRLIFLQSSPDEVLQKCQGNNPIVSEEKAKELISQMKRNYPSKQEGWTNVLIKSINGHDKIKGIKNKEHADLHKKGHADV